VTPPLERPDFITGTLPNGLRWIHQQVASPTGHVGLILQTGSRDEGPDEEGLAHFIEHLLFKGTTRRKAYHILSRIEDVGGELNAYTGKEDTTLYASFLVPHYGRSMELLFDIIQNARFPEREIPKEKEVILDEIDSYRDSPSELIFDEFDALLFGDHPLGRNILGTEESVPRFTRAQVLDFVHRNYRPERAVLSSVGGISAKQFERLAMKYAAPWEAQGPPPSRLPAPPIIARTEHRALDIHQCHLVMGGTGLDAHHADLPALVLVNNLLGGPAMNSRLNLHIRERHGIAYQIESFLNPYSDTGIWGIYAGTDEEAMDRCQRLILQELKQLREVRLGSLQFSKAKTQLLGQMALAQESNANLMTALGKSLLTFNRVDTFSEMVTKIDAVTPAQMQDVAQRVFDPSQISALRFVPKA